MTSNSKKIYIIYGCIIIGENENFSSWEAAAYENKKMAQKHSELADKFLKEVDKNIDDLPDETPFDDGFYNSHDQLNLYANFPPSNLVSYFVGEITISTEKDFLTAMGKA